MSLKQFIERKKENMKLEAPAKTGDIVPFDETLLLEEYDKGLQRADDCCIPGLNEVFSWKRGFQNAFIGWPNDGKTQFTLFAMLIKAVHSDWKFVIWSPEMKSSSFVSGKVIVHYNDLLNELVWMLDGRTPYKHAAERYRIERIPVKEYLELLPVIKERFITIDPEDKKPEAIYNSLKSIYEDQGFDAILIDPFKNVEQDIRVRDDIYLEQLFSSFKDLAVRTNTVMNWIAHPKANVQRIRRTKDEEILMPCDQYMLNGGAAWNNSMDGIYSVFRPDLLENVKSPNVNFLNLKQRKQELTTERGTCTGIEFEVKKRRYIFKGYDPISRANNTPDYQGDQPF